MRLFSEKPDFKISAWAQQRWLKSSENDQSKKSSENDQSKKSSENDQLTVRPSETL